MAIPEIEPAILAAWLAGPPESWPLLLDVRFTEEFEHVALPGAILIPLPELIHRARELEPFQGRRIVVYCHHGVRSLDGTAYLLTRGLDAVSLRGGIDLYARTVDPSLPRY